MENRKGLYRIVLMINILIAICYFCWRIRYTLPVDQGMADMIAAVVFLLTEICGIVFFWMQLSVIQRNTDTGEEPVKLCDPLEYPDVDVFVFDRTHDKKGTANTMNACLLMDYPDKNKVHITTVTGGVRELNEAIFKASSPLVTVIEAGMLPRHEFLSETISRFMAKQEKIGFVQTSFGYFNAGSFQFRLFSQNLVPNERRYFLKCQQPVFARDNSVICCGSGAVFAREALEKTGGFDADAPQGYVITGIRMLKKGYVGKYINRELISGFFDSDIATCIMRRRIRVADAIDALRREHALVGGKLNFRQKKNLFTYLISLSCPFRSIITMIMPALYCILGVRVLEAQAIVLGLFWIAIYASANLCMKGLSGETTSLKWRQIYRYTEAPYLVLPQIKAVLGIYKPKSIDKIKANKLKNVGYFVPHIVLMALNIAAFVLGVNSLIIDEELLKVPFIIWILANLYYELMSIFWLIGIPHVRQENRIEAHISYELKDKIQTIQGITRDLSSRAISIWCDRPYDIDDEEMVSVKLDSGRYQAVMEGRVIGAERDGKKWKYVILLKNVEEYKQQYYGILYDRKPAETRKLAAPQNIFSDISRNIGNRFVTKSLDYRRMARIPINQNIEVVGGNSIFVKNYNYKYVLVKSATTPDEFITIMPVDGIHLTCERVHRFGEHIYQYKVMNYHAVRSEKESREKLYEWVEQCAIENAIGLVEDITASKDELKSVHNM